MSGGLFVTPLALNIKCLIFSGFVLAVYWLPHAQFIEHKIVIAFLLATLSYVLLAWYDVIYDCNDHLRPTMLGWLSMPFKPKEYRKAFDELPLKYKKIVRTVDIVVLVVLVVLTFSPFFLLRKSR